MTTVAEANSYTAGMTIRQLARVVHRFDRAVLAGLSPPNAYILAVLQERAAVYANLPPRDQNAPQPRV